MNSWFVNELYFKQINVIFYFSYIIFLEFEYYCAMGPMHLDIDLYFWMIDRGDIEDDQRNKVEME